MHKASIGDNWLTSPHCAVLCTYQHSTPIATACMCYDLVMAKKLTRSQVGVLGAHALNSKLTADQKTKRGQKAAAIRWGKRKRL
jgi:hypothetical protein